MKKLIILITMLSLIAVVLSVGLASRPVDAADHLDAPGLTPPGGTVDGATPYDITDVYAFQSPECDSCTVIALGVNGLRAPGVKAAFATDAVYEFKVDNDDKNAVENLAFRVKFGPADENGVQSVELRMAKGQKAMTGDGGQVLIKARHGRTTGLGEPPVINEGKHGVHLFAGDRDDPFFFDLPGFLNVTDPTKTFCTSPADTFAGTNVSYIVLEIPNWLLGSVGQIGVWGVTNQAGVQIDRMGRPAINTVFIPNNPFEPAGSEPSQKNAFNAGLPKDDQANFRAEVVDTLDIFYDDQTAINNLADFLLPDLLTLTLDQPTGFPNGRNLADDVIDIELGLVTNNAVTTDCVDGNDKAFSDQFPYLAEPN